MYNDNIPNCVPEYFREKFEREEHEAELHLKLTEHYNANKLKIKKAYEDGLPVLLYGDHNDCQYCKDADHDTQTSDDDDICCVICHNPDCPSRLCCNTKNSNTGGSSAQADPHYSPRYA